MNIEQIARVCHEANRAYCESIGDYSQKAWLDADEWQRESAIKGVQFTIDNPLSSAEAQHESWLQEKLSAGWKHGPIKDAAKKEHPCMVGYEMLPLEQRVKDHIFRNIVLAFTNSEQA